VISSTDLQHWSKPDDPLCPTGTPTPCTFANWATKGFTWAPAVAKVGDNFLMYYTLRQTSSGRQCVSVAVSTSPGGQFVDHSSGPLVCQLDHWGSIDASPFAAGGALYLLWKSDDNAVGAQTHLWGQQLTETGLALVGTTPTRLLDQTRSWQAPAIEGPSMIANGGSYVLFYGAGPWDRSQASIGWARCTSPLGPCTNQSVFGPWLASQPGAQGPSGPAIFTDSAGATRFAFHAWTGGVGYPAGGVRSLFIDQLTFSNGRPVLS
jgi:beta-xylosidase